MINFFLCIDLSFYFKTLLCFFLHLKVIIMLQINKIHAMDWPDTSEFVTHANRTDEEDINYHPDLWAIGNPIDPPPSPQQREAGPQWPRCSGWSCTLPVCEAWDPLLSTAPPPLTGDATRTNPACNGVKTCTSNTSGYTQYLRILHAVIYNNNYNFH